MEKYAAEPHVKGLCNFLLWNGYKVISDKNCVELAQARRHKKRRINKKWMKRYGMKYVPSRKIYVIHSLKVITGHPIVMDKLIEKIKAEEAEQ